MNLRQARLAAYPVIAFLVTSLCAARAAPQSAPPPLADPRETADFLEPLIHGELSSSHVPGAVIVIVKSGSTFFSHGYGYSDLAAHKPVSAERTLFRIGAVTKSVTATAVMQLVEAGRLRLDEDVNHYLNGLQVDRAFPRAVTIRDLLTHTGGFEEQLIGTAEREASGTETLGRYLSSRLPARVRPPGDLISYSEQGYCLLAHIVETVAGIRFDRYVEERILKPLKMNHTVFSPSPEARADAALGYESRGGSFRPAGEICLNIGPAAGLYSTGEDMGRFMEAHLQHSTGNGILKEDTTREMHRQQFTHNPLLPGMAFGFFESYYFNQRALYHSGGIRGYSSLLYLLPDEDLGVFIANNGYRDDMNWSVLDGLIRHYYPASPTKLSPLSDFAGRAARFTGSYQHVKRSRYSIEKIGVLRSGQTFVSSNDDGTLNIYGVRFAEISPMVFRRVDGYERAAFRADGSGKITHLFFDQEAHEKLEWYQTSLVQQLLLWSFLLTFISSFFGWGDSRPSWTLEHTALPVNPEARKTRLFAEGICAAFLVFLAGLAMVFLRIGAGEVWFELPPLFSLLLWLPVLTSVLALALPLLAIRAWRKRFWSLFKRIHFLAVTAACLGFVPWLYYWNLLRFSPR